MSGAPWFKFHASDWLGDHALRLCSAASRGVWIDMLAIMHRAEPYGHLVVAGRSPDSRTIAKLIGDTPKTVERALRELEQNGVLSRTTDLTVFSRRMVRDFERALSDRANGRAGGNPALVRRGDCPTGAGGNGGDNPPHIARERARLRLRSDSDSESDSESPLIETPEKVVDARAPEVPGAAQRARKRDRLPDPIEILADPEFADLAAHTEFASFWSSQWCPYRAQIRRPYRSAIGVRNALREVRAMGPETFIAAARVASANGWIGVRAEYARRRPDGSAGVSRASDANDAATQFTRAALERAGLFADGGVAREPRDAEIVPEVRP